MKRPAFIVIFSFFISMAYGQEGQINIQQDDKIDTLLDIYKSSNEKSGYYTIQVGFGAHGTAQRIKSSVETDFPDLSSVIKFENPTYRVRVGRFKTKIEAERKYMEVRKKYPQAILLKPEKPTN